MLHTAIILGWLIAFGLAVYLATHAIKRRFLGRRRRSSEFRKLRDFRRHHYFDEKGARWVRKVDGEQLIDEVAEDHRFRLVFLDGSSLSSCGKAIGFLNLSNASRKPLVRYNCHTSSCFSSWLFFRLRCICSFVGDCGVQLSHCRLGSSGSVIRWCFADAETANAFARAFADGAR